MNSHKALGLIRTFEYVLAVALGVFVAVVGTSVHRSYLPVALLCAIAAVFAGAVMVRAWIGFGGIAAFGGGWFAVTQILALKGPGGDILMPAQWPTIVWMIAGSLMIVVACFTPRKWFTE